MTSLERMFLTNKYETNIMGATLKPVNLKVELLLFPDIVKWHFEVDRQFNNSLLPFFASTLPNFHVSLFGRIIPLVFYPSSSSSSSPFIFWSFPFSLRFRERGREEIKGNWSEGTSNTFFSFLFLVVFAFTSFKFLIGLAPDF